MDYLIPPDELRTDEFVLRRYEPGDGPALCEAVIATRQHIPDWEPFAGLDMTEELAERRVRQACGRWLLAEDFSIAIMEPDGSRLLGSCGYYMRGQAIGRLITECGMWLRHDRIGQGLGTAVLRTLLAWGFRDWPWQRIEWRCDDRNIASWRTAEKAGMTLEGTLRQIRPRPQDEPRTSRLYAAVHPDVDHA